MVRVFVFLAAVQLVLLVLALISCLSADRVRSLPRPAWVLVILLVPILGPVAYLLAGRPVTARPGGIPGRMTGPRPRPASPDDDADFLRSLNAQQARKDRELLAQWERDLQEREGRTPTPENGTPPGPDDRPGPDDQPGPQERPNSEERPG